MASFYAVQEGRQPEFWRAVEEEMTELARRRTVPGQAVWGASMLASDGILLRGLTTSGRLACGPLLEFWKAARLAVTGSEASPPRKIY